MSSPFKVKAGSASFSTEQPSAGNHAAVCVAVIDLGTHEDDYKGKAYDARKLYLLWEITDEQVKGTKQNHLIERVFNLSFGKKAALRKLIEAWRGKAFADDEEFDVEKLLGRACMLNIVHKASGENMYANVETCGPLPKGMQPGTAQRTPFSWSLEDNGQPKKETPQQDWLPFVYGVSVADTISECKERTGKPFLKALPASNGAHEPDEAAF